MAMQAKAVPKWGEAPFKAPAQRVMQFDNGDGYYYLCESPLPYFEGASHIGYGLGVGDDGGTARRNHHD